MNEHTLVAVAGYTGDAHQIRAFLPVYEHHQCPVIITSPEDSPITEMGPHICRSKGLRAYIGIESLRRQVLHFEVLLSYPWRYCLFNDSDSACLSPEIPRYVYESDVLWSNEVSDMCHQRPATYKLPRLAFQPPYFMSRNVMTQMWRSAKTHPVTDLQTPYIDWVMMFIAHSGKIPHLGYRNGASAPTNNYEPGRAMMRELVKDHGIVFVHSIKTGEVMNELVECRKQFASAHGMPG